MVGYKIRKRCWNCTYDSRLSEFLCQHYQVKGWNKEKKGEMIHLYHAINGIRTEVEIKLHAFLTWALDLLELSTWHTSRFAIGESASGTQCTGPRACLDALVAPAPFGNQTLGAQPAANHLIPNYFDSWKNMISDSPFLGSWYSLRWSRNSSYFTKFEGPLLLYKSPQLVPMIPVHTLFLLDAF
jgi:hypothetical protein